MDSSYPVLDDNIRPRRTRQWIASRETREALDKAGAEPVTSSPAELAAMIRDGVEKYANVVKIAGVKPG